MGGQFTHLARQAPVPPNDRAEIAEAVFGFAAGLDLHDRSLLESVLSPSATVDFTSPARRLGVALPVFEGRRVVAEAIMASIDRLDTSHSVTNLRVTEHDGKHAVARALVEEHYVPRDDSGRHLVLMNGYTVALSSELGRWSIEQVKIDSIWISGDPDVLWLPSIIAARAAGPILLASRRERKPTVP